MKLLVYTPLLTPRIKYIFNFIFTDILKTNVEFNSNLAEFKAYNLPKISYTDHAVGGELFFKCSDLMLAHKIIPPVIKTTVFGDTIVPFAVTGSALPFDLFAASFYFLSRHEEYLPFEPDENGCYPAELSLQNKLGLLKLPVIDGWALILKNILLKKFPGLFFGKKSFEFIPIHCQSAANLSVSAGLFGRSMHFLKLLSGFSNAPKKKPARLEQLHTYLNSIYQEEESRKVVHNCELNVCLPQTYLHLIKIGVTKDYSMGYERAIGFKAGTCTPFLWYDLQLEKTTHLMLHPVAATEKNLFPDKHTKTEVAIEKLQTLIENVKLVNGQFYFLSLHHDI
jgi:hypothetical protein